MRESIQKWHSIVLQTYQALMFESLIHPHNIVTESIKSYVFEDKEELELPERLEGSFAVKDIRGIKTKYFIDKDYLFELPIRVEKTEEMFYKDSARSKSIVLRPLEVTPFRIKPYACWESNKEFIDGIAPFKHSMPDQWTLNKMVAIMGYVGKTFCGVCSLSEFGKSSIYLILDAITKKCPVFQPRSVPGVLAQITNDGNMIFDEVHDTSSEVKSCMENFSLQVAGNSPVYINGAMRSKNTKPKYDVSRQSITFLFNVYSNYSQPQKQFWNFIWSNTKAMESRFLGLKFDGKLEEEFDEKFDISKVAEDNKRFYIKIAKHLLHLKELKFTNSYQRRYDRKSHKEYRGRHKIIYEEITWLIDLYADSQEEYCKFVRLLNKSAHDYKSMLHFTPSTTNEPQATLNNLTPPTDDKIKYVEPELVVEEEVIDSNDNNDSNVDSKTPQERVMAVIEKHVKVNVEILLEEAGVTDEVIDDMSKKGDIFWLNPTTIARL